MSNVIIFANPPFTYSKNLNNYQRSQMKDYKSNGHYDSTFVIKAGHEGLYEGCWIMCASSDRKFESDLIGVDFGKIQTDIISSGTQPERWWITNKGKTKSNMIVSNRTLTDWGTFDSGCTFEHVKRYDESEGKVWVQTFKRGFWADNRDSYLKVTKNDYMISCKVSDRVKIKKCDDGCVAFNSVIINPSEWTLNCITSRVFKIWVYNTGTCKSSNCYNLSIGTSLNTFPLRHGEDLSIYDNMSDEEVFEDLYEKYIKLISN